MSLFPVCRHCAARNPQEAVKSCYLPCCDGDCFYVGHRRHRDERQRRERQGNRLSLVLVAVLVLMVIALAYQLYLAALMLGTLEEDLVRIVVTISAVAVCGMWAIDHICYWYLERHPKHSAAAAFWSCLVVGAIYLGQYWGTL